MGGFVANFAQKVMTGQLPLSVRRLRGERVELCGRSEALFPSLNHGLDHGTGHFPTDLPLSSPWWTQRRWW